MNVETVQTFVDRGRPVVLTLGDGRTAIALLVCWFSVATAVTVYQFCAWLWSVLSIQTAVLIGLWVCVIAALMFTYLVLFFLVGWLIAWWQRRGQS